MTEELMINEEIETSRKLATMTTVKSVSKVPDSDRLDAVRFTTNNWVVVMGRHSVQPGDRVVFFEIDSWIPKDGIFSSLCSDLEGRSNKTMGDKEGYRIRTIKLRGQISQGYAVSMKKVLEYASTQCSNMMPDARFPSEAACPDGTDVTQDWGVKLWQPAPDKGGPFGFNTGLAKGDFPTRYFPKTDEERIQSMSSAEVWKLLSYRYETTEKVDGTSCSIYCLQPTQTNNGEQYFGVCGRNIEIKPNGDHTCSWTDPEGNRQTTTNTITSVYWDMVEKFDIEAKLRAYCHETGRSLSLQGEIVGPGMNGNKQRLAERLFLIFKVFDIDNQQYLPVEERRDLVVNKLGLLHVHVLDENLSIAPTVRMLRDDLENLPEDADWDAVVDRVTTNIVERLIEQAKGKSVFGRQREGIVLKSIDNPNISFKVINNDYLLDHHE